MKKIAALILCLMIALSLAASAEEITVTGKVTEIEKYGHALLDITIDDFNEAGFSLGDIVTVTAGSYTGDIPYFNGYYVDRGEYMVRAYPGHTNIAVCINYGKFAETAGVGVGDTVTLTLKEKGGALILQEINNLVYGNDREDFASDEVFANFRPVTAGGIADGKLYRSASPVNNSNGRAAAANALAEAAGVSAVMNLDNTDEELNACFAAEDFVSDYYRGLYDAGHVLPMGMSIDYTSETYAQELAAGMTFLAGQDTPFLVHCAEGKDRAGFAVMVLEALMGAGEEEIVADYMLSYTNYYGTEPGSDQYEMIAEKNIREMLRFVSGLEKGASLEGADLAAAAENYLLTAGMKAEDVAVLKEKLGGQADMASSEAETDSRTAQDLIEDMVVYYGSYGSSADRNVDHLLAELGEADPVLGEKWAGIMKLWQDVQADYPVHTGILPDGLPQTDELCLVVLGFQLNPDGSMKDELVERLKVALASAEKYPQAYIVCTGGGTAAEEPSATEAGRMAEWLIDSGIAPERVIVENQSLTTAQNAVYTYQILTQQYPQVKKLAIVSSDYHIATGVLLFGAETVLQAEETGKEQLTIVSNAAYPAPSGTLSSMFQAGALIELSGDVETAFEIYYETYDIHELPALHE